jgi:acyl-CoA dehydrogenase
MINLELPNQLVGLKQLMHAIAKDMFRPISRKYDRQEHDEPVELAALDRRKSRQAARDKSRDEPRPAPGVKRENKNGSSLATVVSVEEMCWGDVGLMLSVPGGGLGNAAIDAVATPEQKDRFGSCYASMAITEPGTGSDSANVATTARLDGDEWVLNGEKIFVTAGARCDTVVVWATLDKSKGKAAIKSFVVPKGAPGMEVVGLEHKMGIRASDTATINFADCRIPRGNILGSEDIAADGDKAAFGKVMQTFDNTRPTVAAMAVGVARAALELTRELLKLEPSYTGPVWDLGALEAELLRLEADWEAARLLVLKAAWMSDNREPNSMEASMAKAKAGRMGNQVTLRCVELCGSVGYSEHDLLEKFARDSKIIDIFEGTQQIQQLIVARRLLNKSSGELK